MAGNPNPVQRKHDLQRERRARQKREISQLHHFIRHLEQERQAWESHPSVRCKPLSNRQVAQTLAEYADAAVQTNQRLKKERDQLLQVIAHMTKWIAAAKGISRGPQAAESPTNNLSLHLVTLSATNSSCRRHGLDWITQILHRNTDSMLEKYEFWSDWCSDVRADAFVDVSNPDSLQTVWRFQLDIPASLEAVTPQIRQHVVQRLNSIDIDNARVDPIDHELVHQVSTTMTYYRRVYSDIFATNILYREFRDPDRCVFVGQNLYDDKFTVPDRRYKGMTWVVVTRLAPHATRVSLLSMQSLWFAPDGPLSVLENAKMFKLDREGEVGMEPETFATRFRSMLLRTSVSWSEYLTSAYKGVCAASPDGSMPGDSKTE